MPQSCSEGAATGQSSTVLVHKANFSLHVLVCLQLGRIETTKEPKLQKYVPEDSQGYGVPGPAGGQFGQQWDEQQYPPMQPAYNYGNPDDIPQVLYQIHAFVSLQVTASCCSPTSGFLASRCCSLHQV